MKPIQGMTNVISDPEASNRCLKEKIDLIKHDLAAEIALGIERLRLTAAETAGSAGLTAAQLRGIVEQGAVSEVSVRRLEEVLQALAALEPPA